MDLPDFSAVTDKISQGLPEVMYATVDEAAAVNRQKIDANVAYFRDNPAEIDRRINELQEEWDVARVLQVVSSGATLAAFWFSLTKSRLWLLVPLVLAGGSLQLGLTGASPAVDFARRLGFRTREEIEAETVALQAIRGDFAGSGGSNE